MFWVLLIQIITAIIGAKIFLPYNLGKKKMTLLVLLGQGVGYPLFGYIGIPAVFVVMLLFLIVIIFRESKSWVAVLAVIFPWIFMIITEYLLSILFSFLDFSSLGFLELILSIFHSALTSLISLLFMFFMGKMFKLFQLYEILESSYGKIFIGFLFCTLIIFYTNILIDYSEITENHLLLVRGGFFTFYIFLLVAILIVFSKILAVELKVKAEQVQLENEKRQLEQQGDYIEKIEAIQEEVRGFKHDLKNTLLCLSDFIRTEDMEGLKAYFSKYTESINKELNKEDYRFGQIKNLAIKELKGLIMTKIIEAESLNVKTTLFVPTLIDEMTVDLIELSRMLGILLDNALEEVKMRRKGEVYIAVVKELDTISIVIANDCGTEIPSRREIFSRGFSTKGKNRGLGLSNLEELVAKNPNIELQTEITGEIFKQQINIRGVEKNA